MKGDPTVKNGNIGKVFLVGAGPGDPGLITVKGQACLADADVVLHDRLVNRRLLAMARPDAELIYCGKSPEGREMRQDEINQILVDRALQGKRVCRLKGGDPFVFGRGGEEALALAEHNIPFEIVPGVTSAIAVPAYAGIPVTHRGISTSVAVVTGHEDPEKPVNQVDWVKLATAADTLVVLMGVGNFASIADGLLRGGRDPQMAVAIISRGTLPEQTTLITTLASAAREAETAGIRPPAIVIIGDVVRLRPELGWFDGRPLFGKTGLVTRTAEQAGQLSATLEDAGASVVEFPVIRIAPPESWAPLDDALSQIEGFDWVVFTSANGIAKLQERLETLESDIRTLKGPRIAVVGPGTASAARAAGLRVSLCPEEYVAESLAEALIHEGIDGKRVLLLQAAQARVTLAEKLAAAGADVVGVPVYQTLPASPDDPEAIGMLADGRVDFVTFTSSSSARYFAMAVGPEQARELLLNVCVACIGPITAATVRGLGVEPAVVAEEHTIPGLVAGLAAHFAQETRRSAE
ncbi:MAG: uroporphyrinogen-III C-methyltransferase [Armatimonadetes bacterium]|nr:uroporphyrinogen-III C-methyltransferase [Armatimonadota bacterium]